MLNELPEVSASSSLELVGDERAEAVRVAAPAPWGQVPVRRYTCGPRGRGPLTFEIIERIHGPGRSPERRELRRVFTARGAARPRSSRIGLKGRWLAWPGLGSNVVGLLGPQNRSHPDRMTDLRRRGSFLAVFAASRSIQPDWRGADGPPGRPGGAVLPPVALRGEPTIGPCQTSTPLARAPTCAGRGRTELGSNGSGETRAPFQEGPKRRRRSPSRAPWPPSRRSTFSTMSDSSSRVLRPARWRVAGRYLVSIRPSGCPGTVALGNGAEHIAGSPGPLRANPAM